MRIHLGGHLVYYQEQKQAWFIYELSHTAPITEVVAQLGIPLAEIAFFIVNDEVVDLHNKLVDNSDTLQIYPPNDGG